MKTKTSIELNTRICLEAPTQNSVPEPPTKEEMDFFNKRYSSKEQIDNTIRKKFTSFGKYINDAKKKFKKLREACTDGSTISNNILQLEEEHGLLIFEGIAAMGLKRFAPDFSGDPNSIYNLVHERLCLFLFRQVASTFGYAFMQCDLSNVQNDTSSQVLLYRNFLWGRVAPMVKKERDSPGRVVEDNERNNMYGRRSKVCFYFIYSIA